VVEISFIVKEESFGHVNRLLNQNDFSVQFQSESLSSFSLSLDAQKIKEHALHTYNMTVNTQSSSGKGEGAKSALIVISITSYSRKFGVTSSSNPETTTHPVLSPLGMEMSDCTHFVQP
jgi:hypothetical protein